MERSPRIALVAGETSGDLLAGLLLSACGPHVQLGVADSATQHDMATLYAKAKSARFGKNGGG